MTPPRVLVVDDEPGMLRAIERVLAPTCEVFAARAPGEALNLVAGGLHPDLALLDIRMPEMSGFELMDRLRALRPDIDVLFMTGSINQLDAQLIRAIRLKAFYFIQKPFDREVLLTLVERCLDLRRLSHANRRHLARLEDDLEQARRFQQSLFPPPFAVIGGVSIAARCVQYAGLGGDFYDYTAVGAHQATLLVVDICGHGVPAAMISGMVKSAFHTAHGDDYTPLSVVERVADVLRRAGHRRFVTLYCGRIDSRAHVLEYASAGHPPGLLRRGDGHVQRLESTGTIICADLPDQVWTQETVEFGIHDQLLLFTDGVTESDGADGQFGNARLARLAAESTRRGGELLVEVLQHVHNYASGRPGFDDQTLMIAGLE